MKIVVEPSVLNTKAGVERLTALCMLAVSWENRKLVSDINYFVRKRSNEVAILDFSDCSSDLIYVPRGIYYRNIPSINDVITVNNSTIKLMQPLGGCVTMEIPERYAPILYRQRQSVADILLAKVLEKLQTPSDIDRVAEAIIKAIDAPKTGTEPAKKDEPFKPRLYAKLG